MKISRQQWLVCWGVLGLIIPVVLIVSQRICVAHSDRTQLVNCLWDEREVMLWPTSLMLMPLKAHLAPFDVIWFYGLAIVLNIFVYATMGLLTWLFAKPFVGRDPSEPAQ